MYVFIFNVGFCTQYIVGFCLMIHSDNLLISIFTQLIFKVIIDIIGVISTILFTVSYQLPLFRVFTFVLHILFFCSCGFDWAFYMILFSSLAVLYDLTIFNDCSGVCNIHLQLIQFHFQIMLCHSVSNESTWYTHMHRNTLLLILFWTKWLTLRSIRKIKVYDHLLNILHFSVIS